LGEQVEAWAGDSQEWVWQTEEAKKEDVHGCGDEHNCRIKVEEPPVLGQTIRNQAETHQVKEVQIESQIDDKEKGFLCFFEDHVQRFLVFGGRWQLSRNPNHVDGDVNAPNGDEEPPFEPPSFLPIGHDQGDAVGNDLGKELRLDRP